MIILGFDPGAHGALVLCEFGDGSKPAILGKWLCPNTDLDGSMFTRLEQLCNLAVGLPIEVVAERPFAFAKQAAHAACEYGMGAGIIAGALHVLTGSKIHWYHPASWKAKSGLTGQDKKSSIVLAMNRFANGPEELNPIRDSKARDGAAEAALLAYYHWQVTPQPADA